MSRLTRWKVGGPADLVVSPGSITALVNVIRFLSENQIPWLIIGHTSNLLFADEGIRAVVIEVSDRLAKVEVEGQTVRAQAGIWVPSFARMMASHGLVGAEHIVGIPGTLGGLICMNGGSLRRGIGENIQEVECVDRTGKQFKLSQQECEFKYRTSAIQANRWVVLQATFGFEFGNRRSVRKAMLEILRSRKKKFPLKQPNCGSVFVSDPGLYEKYGPPGAILERCGLKGKRIGGAEVSPCHANFIVNIGGAKATDVLQLIQLARSAAAKLTGVKLVCEVRYVSPNGSVVPAHEINP